MLKNVKYAIIYKISLQTFDLDFLNRIEIISKYSDVISVFARLEQRFTDMSILNKSDKPDPIFIWKV